MTNKKNKPFEAIVRQADKERVMRQAVPLRPSSDYSITITVFDGPDWGTFRLQVQIIGDSTRADAFREFVEELAIKPLKDI